MIRDKVVDEVFRIIDLAYCHTIVKVNKDLNPPMSMEEMGIPLIRLQKKMDEYMLREFLVYYTEEEIAKNIEPEKGFAHFR